MPLLDGCCMILVIYDHFFGDGFCQVARGILEGFSLVVSALVRLLVHLAQSGIDFAGVKMPRCLTIKQFKIKLLVCAETEKIITHVQKFFGKIGNLGNGFGGCK